MNVFINFDIMKKLIKLICILIISACTTDVEPIEHTLSTSVSPENSGTINPSTGTVNNGEEISITATPAAEFVFDKWTGDVSGTDNTIAVKMDSNKSVTANFIKKKYALTTSVQGQGTIAEKVIKVGAATDYNSGTIIELTANSESGWKFKEWSGDLTGSENPKQITIDKAKTVKAVFEELPFYLDANGITIKARDWVSAGTTGQIGGITYTLVDKTTLKDMVSNDQDVTKVVTSGITDMSSLFGNKPNFNQDISSWDVSKVTNMSFMFTFATKFNKSISEWNTSSVEKMDWMFYQAYDFDQDISKWNTNKVTIMRHMFGQAKNFNQNIGNWDLSNVTDIGYMFTSTEKFNQDISGWDVSKVVNMDGTFAQALAFNQNLTKWCVTNIISEPTRFTENSALTEANKPVWGTCPASGNSYAISVSASSSADYTLSGTDKNGNISGNDPNLTFKVGDEITFSVNSPGHPFYLKTVAGTGTGNQISGVTNNGTSSGSVVWTPTAAGTYYYQCSLHSAMVGSITIEN